jgi:hypothetical protein
MMAITGGRARSRLEMEALLTDAGLSAAKIFRGHAGLAFIEATGP